MATALRYAALALVLPVGLRAEERFSQSLTSADFAAAGLNRLSADELAHLDRLAQVFQARAAQGTPAGFTPSKGINTRPRGTAPAAPESTVVHPADREGFRSEPARQVKKTAPSAIETSRIIGTVSGWDPRTKFSLENGEVWTVANYDYYTCPAVKDPVVEIRPAAFGGFWMRIGSLPEVRVRLVSKPTTAP